MEPYGKYLYHAAYRRNRNKANKKADRAYLDFIQNKKDFDSFLSKFPLMGKFIWEEGYKTNRRDGRRLRIKAYPETIEDSPLDL